MLNISSWRKRSRKESGNGIPLYILPGLPSSSNVIKFQVKTMAHFVITSPEQEGPLAGDTWDSKTSALLRTMICTAIWSTTSFVRDYLMIPCYLHGTQRFTEIEQHPQGAGTLCTASSEGTGAARMFKTTKCTKYTKIASHGLCSVTCRQLSNFTGRFFCCSLRIWRSPCSGKMAVGGGQCFVITPASAHPQSWLPALKEVPR